MVCCRRPSATPLGSVEARNEGPGDGVAWGNCSPWERSASSGGQWVCGGWRDVPGPDAGGRRKRREVIGVGVVPAGLSGLFSGRVELCGRLDGLVGGFVVPHGKTAGAPYSRMGFDSSSVLVRLSHAFWHHLPGAGVFGGRHRVCRRAQPPATFCDASGAAVCQAWRRHRMTGWVARRSRVFADPGDASRRQRPAVRLIRRFALPVRGFSGRDNLFSGGGAAGRVAGKVLRVRDCRSL